MTEISHFFNNVCIVAGPGFVGMLESYYQSLVRIQSLSYSEKLYELSSPICSLHIARAHWISVVDDRKSKSNDLMPKGNLLALVNGKQSGSTHFGYSPMLHRHSSDLALLSSVLLLCS